jgi:hypothetical protein
MGAQRAAPPAAPRARRRLVIDTEGLLQWLRDRGPILDLAREVEASVPRGVADSAFASALAVTEFAYRHFRWLEPGGGDMAGLPGLQRNPRGRTRGT